MPMNNELRRSVSSDAFGQGSFNQDSHTLINQILKHKQTYKKKTPVYDGYTLYLITSNYCIKYFILPATSLKKLSGSWVPSFLI